MQYCNKKIYWCTDPTAENHSSLANQDAKNCTYKEVINSRIIENFQWAQGTTIWSTTISWPEITEEVMNSGAVNLYIGSNNEWQPLPYVALDDNSYSTTLTGSFSLGEIFLQLEDSDGTLSLNPNGIGLSLKAIITK